MLKLAVPKTKNLAGTEVHSRNDMKLPQQKHNRKKKNVLSTCFKFTTFLEKVLAHVCSYLVSKARQRNILKC